MSGLGVSSRQCAEVRAVDVLVVGGGLAGLHTATLLGRRGHDVLLVDGHSTLAGTIRTTGIFVRKTLEDFYLPSACLGPPIRRVVLYPARRQRPVTLVSDRDEYRVADMAAIYHAAAEAAAEAGVQIWLRTRYTGRSDDAFLVVGPQGPVSVRTRFVVGADGARSRVAHDLGLDRNRHLLVGAEEIYPVPGMVEPPTFHCVIDPSVAPWVSRLGGQRRPARPCRRRRLPAPVPRRTARGTRTVHR